MREHVAALYAFARIADDIADEGEVAAEDRQAQLRAWQERLHAAAQGQDVKRGTGNRDDLILTAIGHSIRSLDLPLSLFDDLVSAFRQDTMTTRYASWCDVLDYCRRSANPVGRLVLRIAGYRDGSLDQSADALCTALQLTNFWQDFGRDWRVGRLYVPREVAGAYGADEQALSGPALTGAWMTALDLCIAETRRHFAAGRAVCDEVRGRLRYELRVTWLGGARMLEQVERTRATLLTHRPTLGAGDVAAIVWRAASWRSHL